MGPGEQEVVARTVRITTDVTAIKILNQKIFAGVGGSLLVFELTLDGESRLTQTLEIFDGQKVHGIVYSRPRSLLLVYGGPRFVTLNADTLEKIDGVNFLPHWIHAAHWLEEENAIAFALSSNSVCLWKDGKVSETVACPIKCILYSALLVGSLWTELVVFSGTVFSEVLVWGTDGVVWHQLRGHKGVIFSIIFDPRRQRLLTSSDDRSVRVWQKDGDASWATCTIDQVQVLYGHQSRVWRAIPTNFGLVSIGEDSAICQWDQDGKEMAKVCAHQGGSVWSADLDKDLLVTGGGDGGIMTWKLGQQPEATQCDFDLNVRKVSCSNHGCVVLSEDGELHREDADGKITRVPDVRGQILEVADNLVFVLSIDGQLTILESDYRVLVTGKVSETTVLSLVVLNSNTFLISSVDGRRTLWSRLEDGFQKIGDYEVQTKSKGAACGLAVGSGFLIGDQEGYVHLISSKGSLVSSLNLKSEGVTSLCLYRNLICVGCKEGRLVTLRAEGDELDILTSGQPRLGMIAGLQVTPHGLLLLSFYKEFFTAWSWDQQRPVFRLNCPGGGHRPWSFLINESNAEFCFIRHKKIFLFRQPISQIISPAIRIGLHLRLVNCLVKLDDDFVISGGEDGSLRVYQTDSGMPSMVVQAHLSSVKTLLKSKNLLLSAGGRAQLNLWQTQNSSGKWSLRQLHNHMLLDVDKPIKVPWRETYLNPRPDPETRYMSLCVLSHNDANLVFLAACSDSLLRVFKCSEAKKSLELVNTIAHHRNCVLSVSSAAQFAVSGSSDGVIAIWAATDLLESGSTPLHSARVHQGGVTSVVLTTNSTIVSGGDDGRFCVNRFVNGGFKCIFESDTPTQLTGIELFENYAISTSSGQKVTLWESNNAGSWSKKYERTSTVADLQGIAVIYASKNSVKACVYGKGSEVISLNW